MEDEIEPSKEFTKGFNDAYLLGSHEPKILSGISPVDNPQNTYFDGFFMGKLEWEREQQKTQVQDLNKLRNKEKEQGRER